jgi:Putative beta-barrel porin-2, OmpL-like. bbp2
MYRHQCAILGLVLALAGVAAAQTPPASDNAPKPLTGAGIDFSGLVDGYYSLNLGHPASKTNTWRNFDIRANSFALNFAKFSMEHTADPVGFKLELAAGRAMDIFHATDPAGSEVVKHLLQAYVSLKPKSMNGFQFDFGKFVTSAGAEVTETHLNWNYSRALLYANGPYYHFGARTSYPFNSKFSAGFQLVNGWNNVEDNNSSKTVGFTTALTTSKLNWFNNYYVGNEKTDTLDGVKIRAEGLRHFYDMVLAINPNGKVSGLFNFDYGVDKNPIDGDAKFYGFSVAMRALGGEHFAISPRYDWYKDRDGFITGGSRTLQEFTLTGDYKLTEGFLTRLEYRRDWSSTPFYDRGNEPGSAKSMNTFLIGFVVYFNPGH